jgi:predicted dehydrogenase
MGHQPTMNTHEEQRPAPDRAMPTRRLRLGMVGGGLRGNIGRSHRAAALLDGRWDIVAGALSRDPSVAEQSGKAWLIAPERSYPSFGLMAKAEAARQDRIDAVTICTTNETHYAVACAFMDLGFHVICDKPLTTSPENAEDLVRRARRADVLFAVTYNYSGYPMVRMARDMVARGDLGDIRSVAVEYVSQYQTDATDGEDWQTDPARSGPLGVVAGTGTHAHHLAEFVTGLRIAELSADLASLVDGRRLEDHATMHLRFSNGARGLLWCTTVAPGNENGLRIRVYGSLGGIEWSQEHPNHMIFTRKHEPSRVLSRGGFAQTASARAATRLPSGAPEGYLEAFANLYSDVADAIWALTPGQPPTQRSFPTVEDGARGVRFMFAALESAQSGSRFVSTALDYLGDRA